MIEKLKTALVLLIIGAVSGALIFGTNELTEDGIIEIRAEREQAYYKAIFDVEDDRIITFEEQEIDGVLTSEITIYDENSDVLGYIYKGEETNTYGQITVLIGVREDGTIAEVVISSSTNTPIFVKRIEDNYLPNFANQDADAVVFDDKTGASYTYGSVELFVGAASEYYTMNRGAANE